MARGPAYEAVERVAQTHDEFISDDVWIELAAQGYPEKPREPRALGAIMGKAARAGLMADSGRTRKTANKTSHANPVRVWRSRVYVA